MSRRTLLGGGLVAVLARPLRASAAGSPDVGIRYVALSGDDGNDGLSWATAKATIQGAQASGSPIADIRFNGRIPVDSPIELVDGQYLTGINPHASFGSVLYATPSLGSNPVLVNSAHNLTSGGLRHFRIEGGLHGFHSQVGSKIADNWTIDDVTVKNAESHGFYFAASSETIAGNPLWLGFLNAFNCGGDGVRLERPNRGTVRFGHLGGDDNQGSLLHIETLNDEGFVRIDNLKHERHTDGRHQNVVTVHDAFGGGLSIGGFRSYNSASGSNGHALIANSGGQWLRLQVGYAFHTTYNTDYDLGFDGAIQIPLADFLRRPIEEGF